MLGDLSPWRQQLARRQFERSIVLAHLQELDTLTADLPVAASVVACRVDIARRTVDQLDVISRRRIQIRTRPFFPRKVSHASVLDPAPAHRPAGGTH